MKTFSIIILLFIGVIIYSCDGTTTRTEIELEPIFNPYDTVTYADTTMINVEVDSTSFLGLHYHIFSNDVINLLVMTEHLNQISEPFKVHTIRWFFMK